MTSRLKRLWSQVPSGGSLPESVWRARHRFLIGLTFFHAVIIALAAPFLGKHFELSFRALFDDDSMLHIMGEGLIVASFGALAFWRRAGRTIQATFVGFGLMSASAILVHLSGGYIEFHFHFFVMLTFLALCQDWIPYLLAVAFVAVHHGVVGVLWPQSVYNHEAAFNSPWTWAGIHAAFVLWSCLGSVVAWRFNERAFAQTALILQAAGEGIFGVDTEGRVTFINPTAASILGVNAGSAVGKRFGQIAFHLATDGTRLREEDSPVLAPLKDRKGHHATDQIFGRLDGSYLPVDYVSTPITGLGLSLVHSTIERHGGTLAIESEPGRGSTFIVRLPCGDSVASPSAPAELRAPLRPLRVLLVDDDELVRKSVVAQLTSQGHTVETAINGREGLERFSAGSFDLVVTDRAMPELGGDQVAAQIERSAPDTPVIMLTGFGDLMTAKGEHPAGVDAIVSKPVTLNALTEAIRKVTARVAAPR